MDVAHRRLMRLNPRNGLAVFHGALQQVRHFHHPVVNQDHQRLVHLDGGGSPVPLTDAHRNGVPLVPGFLEALELPFAGWHVARALFRKVDTGVVAVAKLAHPLREAIDAHVIGDLIEIGIRRLLQRFGDVQVAVAPFFPVTIAFIGARQLPPAWVEQAGIAGDHPGAQRRDGDVRFYR